MHPASPVLPNADLPEIMVAETQPEYETLPSIDCGNGMLLTRWKLNEDEINLVKETGDVYLFIKTFGNPVQPVLLQVEKPMMATEYEDECLSATILE